MIVQVIPVNPNDPIALATIDGADHSTQQLKHLQHIVGGYVEMVNTPTLSMKNNCMLVDEDGVGKGKFINHRAMSISGYAGTIVGTAIIAGLVRDEDGAYDWGTVNE